jgi:tetratricopeptide (TPR) repeat protein
MKLKNPLIPLFTKLGLNEQEQGLVMRALAISSGICVLLVAAFAALNLLTTDGGAGEQPVRETYYGSDEVTELDIAAHEFAAARFMQAGQPDLALPHLHRVAAVRRGEPAALQALDRAVTAYLELGEFNRAISAADQIVGATSAPLSVSLEVRKGIAFYHMKEFDVSTRLLRGALARDPNNAEALTFMGQMEAAAVEGRSPTAERFFRRAIEADSMHVEARYQFARYLENNKDFNGARDFLQQVLAKDPLHVRSHARLGMIYYYENNAEQALRSYQTALALNPLDYNTRYNLGELYRNLLEDNESALREFVAVLNKNPRHREANFRAGLICAENEMMKEAVRYFEASLYGDRENVRKLLLLAAAYERVGDRAAALAVYREVAEADPLHSIAIQKIRFLQNPD